MGKVDVERLELVVAAETDGENELDLDEEKAHESSFEVMVVE